MLKGLLERRVEELAGDAAQRDNAIALLSALDGTALNEIESEGIWLNPYTDAICFGCLVSGEWDSFQVEIYSDHFETYLSRDQELRINHWACEPRLPALENVIGELLAGRAERSPTTQFQASIAPDRLAASCRGHGGRNSSEQKVGSIR